MKFETTPEQQEKLRKLTAYIEKQKDGAELSWLRIEHDTKIVMDQKGRNMFRTYLVRARGRGGYESIRGEGVRLSSPSSALDIVNNFGRRLGRGIRNWAITADTVRERHFEGMSRDDQQQLLAKISLAGAFRSMAHGCSVTKTLPAPKKDR